MGCCAESTKEWRVHPTATGDQIVSATALVRLAMDWRNSGSESQVCQASPRLPPMRSKAQTVGFARYGAMAEPSPQGTMVSSHIGAATLLEYPT